MVAERMQTAGEQPADLLVDERNLLSVAHKNAVGGRRAVWDVTSAEQIPKDIQLESVPKRLITGNVVPCGDDTCAPVSLQNVQISGSVADGHEVLARADKILRVIKKHRAEKYLGMFTEIAEKIDDHEKFDERFGECSNPGNRGDSTIGAKIAELLSVNASKSDDEQLSLKECVNRMNGYTNDIYSIIGESVAAVASFLVLGILRKKSLQEESAVKVQKTVEVPQVQYIDKNVDVPVVRQGQVPTVQAVQKTVEVPQFQFHDRAVDFPVSMQRQLPQERIQELIVEETDAPVPHVMGEITEVAKHISQEQVLNYTVEQIGAVPVPQIPEETKQVTHRTPQDRISDCNGEQNINCPILQIQEKLVGMIQLILKERMSERIGAKLASGI